MTQKSNGVANKLRERKVSRADPPSFMFTPVHIRALENIDPGLAKFCKVTSIVAPVGYGKTVLMSMLYARRQSMGERCFWTALDAGDSTLDRLLGLLETMLYGPSTELHPTQVLLRGSEPPEVRLESLLDVASRFTQPVTVFIDNLNSCTDMGLESLLERLVFASPASVRFVFSSTLEIPLNLTRAKLEGLVRQVGYHELSLDVAEVAELLGEELSSAIGPAGVETVARQTEGWPAAVRMAQIILSGSDRPLEALEHFSGSDEDIAALLNRQVLSGFSPELREFLFSIAQLRTFCGEMCCYVTGSDQAEQFLSELLRRNVFVIPLDRNRVWYRIHGLFREYLLSEARHQLGQKRRQLVLQRAAEWCEQGCYWRDAIDYALLGNASGSASRVLERTAALFVRDRGDVLQYTTWVETLHRQGEKLGLEAEYWYVWALILHRRNDFGRQQNEALAERVRLVRASGEGDAAWLDDLLRRIDIIRTCIGIFTDDLKDACQNAAHWISSGMPADDPFNAMAAVCSESIYYSSAFMFGEAREAMQMAQTYAFQVNSAYANAWIVSLSALPPLYEGDYAAVYQELVAALTSARITLGDGAGICGTIALLAAKCAIETGIDDEAGKMLKFGLRTAKLHGFVDAVACGLDAAVCLWSGSDSDPVTLTELREVAASFPPRLTFMLSCYLVRRLICLGRTDEAIVEAARIGLIMDDTANRSRLPRMAKIARCRDLFVATEIELCIATAKHKQAEILIADETKLAKVDGRSGRLVELALANMAIAAQAGDDSTATRHLTRAVSMAAMRGVVRPFRDRAGVIAILVEDTKPAAWGFALAKERKFFAEICRMLPISNRSLQDRLVELNIESHLLDTLSSRQIELLGLLDAGLSNQQIADHIDVTLSTVKGHLQRLFGKLGVSSRSAALARARVLNLLP